MDLSTQRIVDNFPTPYNLSCSPYSSLTFDREIRDYCDQNVNLLTTSPSDPFSKCSKVILVGDMAVGKTCLLNRFTYDTFGLDHKATIGVDFAIIKFKILQFPFQLQVWDTAGQERFQSIAENYYRNAHAAIICFDLSNIATLSNVTTWATRIIAGNKVNKIPLIFLVGTKMDCLTDSTIKFVETEAIKVATSLSAEYWSVSAQTGFNVETLFKRVAALSFSEIILNTIEQIKEEKENQAAIQYSANFVKLSKRKNFALIKSCMVNKCVYKK